MKVNGSANTSGKDRKRKICGEQSDELDSRTKVPQSASRRHREKINATLEELGGLLPLPEDARSKLDKLTVLKLSVSFFQTQNYLQSGKRKRRVDDAAVAEVTKKLAECHLSVSDISLEALDSFFLVLSDSGDVFFVSENVYRYLGYTQTFLMHQNFLNFVHHEDVVGFEKSLRRAARARIIELEDGQSTTCEEFEEQPIPQVCFCSIRCHAGRQSSHVSPFYYRSFKFDGNIKPLLSGKMKQYGFFALCTPVNPANPFTSTPKELLQMYSCKLGLDLKVRKLDNRGQKTLYLNEKDILSQSGYFFVHPDDAELMVLCHQQVTTDGESSEVVFRLMNGHGNWQWVRGKARMLYDKGGSPENVATDNVLLNDEQGHYFRQVAAEALYDWRARQKGLPSPQTDDEKPREENSPQSVHAFASAASDTMGSSGPGVVLTSDESMLQDSKDIEIIEYSTPPLSVEERKAHVLPSLGPPVSVSDSCMFGSPQLNKSPADEKPNILSHDGMTVNCKIEHRNGDSTNVNSRRNHTAHDQINLIKQFLMGENNQPPPNSCQHGETVRIDGGIICDSPPPWADYPADPSSVLPDFNFHQDNRSGVPCPPCPPENGTQPSLHVNGFDHIPDILPGRGNGLQCGRHPQVDPTNHIYPFLPDMSTHADPPVSNPYVNGVHNEDIGDVHVELAMNGINTTLQSGTDLLPPYLRQEGTVIHSLQQRLSHNGNGFCHSQKQSNYQTVNKPPTENHLGYDFMGHPSTTDLPRQDPSLWFRSSNTSQSNQNSQLPQVDEVISIDDLTPSLFADPMVPFGNPENPHSKAHFTGAMPPANVYPAGGMHLNQPVGQHFQTPPILHQKRDNEGASQSFQPSGNNSILKMMLTL